MHSYFLAKKPSKISVIAARVKNNAARKLDNLPGKFKKINKSGIQASLKVVNILGKLDFLS
jgi:hypothetical protein